MTALLLALLALQTPVDEGTLVVREDTVEGTSWEGPTDRHRPRSVRLDRDDAGWVLNVYPTARPGGVNRPAGDSAVVLGAAPA